MVGPHGGKMDSVKVDTFTGGLQAFCHSGTEECSLAAWVCVAVFMSDIGQGMYMTADKAYRCPCPEVIGENVLCRASSGRLQASGL